MMCTSLFRNNTLQMKNFLLLYYLLELQLIFRYCRICKNVALGPSEVPVGLGALNPEL